jgi:hypothetical protein
MEEPMSPSTTQQLSQDLKKAFTDACDALEAKQWDKVLSALHPNVVTTKIDDPLAPPICGNTVVRDYLKDKGTNEPHTKLDYDGQFIDADSDTGIVAGVGFWQDDDNGVKHRIGVKYRFHFTRDLAGTWLLINMYAERTP